MGYDGDGIGQCPWLTRGGVKIVKKASNGTGWGYRYQGVRHGRWTPFGDGYQLIDQGMSRCIDLGNIISHVWLTVKDRVV
ncbi:MAG: hypothetical protein JWP34_5379 [Massilia sp.]|nr:hypothetical protein [Massilia sp.]